MMDVMCRAVVPTWVIAAVFQVKKAYFQLAKKYHPDQNQGNPDAKKKFQEVTEVCMYVAR